MSRIRDDYETSFTHRFTEFVRGDRPLPEEDHTEEWRNRVAEVEEQDRVENALYLELPETDPLEDAKRFARLSGVRIFRRIYYVLALLMLVLIIGMLLLNLAYMPRFGSADSPVNNEVSERYLEKAGEETGAVNTVTGMILQYRAFDTFGETNVLFIAACTVMILLLHRENTEEEAPKKKTRRQRRRDRREKDAAGVNTAEALVAETSADAENALVCALPQNFDTEETEDGGDIILQSIARVVVPLIFLFGLYILLNGHLSPGGGFSGGAVIGAGLILYNASFGFRKTRRFFDEKVYDVLKVGSLCLYACIIAYYLFTGANGIKSIVPLGTLGNLISSGLILPINLLVGIEVACTMYAFYALFRRGSF